MTQLAGVGVSGGRACAPPYLFETQPAEAELSRVGSADPATAHALLLEAIARTREELVEVEMATSERLGNESAAIFHAHRMILDDPEWLEPITRRTDAGEPAASAVWLVSDALAAELAEIEDEYLSARADDVRDVGRRVLRHLGVRPRSELPGPGDGEVILIARELTPSDTITLDPAVVRGIVTEIGTRTSHAAILARQLGIPAVVAIDGALESVRGTRIIAIDGDSGTCELDPDAEAQSRHRIDPAERAPIVRQVVSTEDGAAVVVAANASSAQEVAEAIAAGADAIGLYRTEFLFLRAGVAAPPSEEAQFEEYCAAAAAARGRPIVFRTLDIGADKSVPGVALPQEMNPFLGVRGVRFSLRELPMFEAQLRALGRASREYANVRVMLPMVSGPRELEVVHGLLEELGLSEAVALGAMVEVPSAAVLVREMAPLVRFFSVGTNDLTGYVLAADRTNMQLGELYDELHPAVLRFLRMINEAAVEHDTSVSICGDIAGDPLATAVLIGLGYRSLSVATPLVPRIKAIVPTLRCSQAKELARAALASRGADEVRALLRRVPASVA